MAQVIIQAVLESAELFFLLQAVGVQAIFGANNADLFPENTTARTAKLDEGLQALKSHGWLRETIDEKNRWNLDIHLTRLIATIADPGIVLILTRYPNEQEKQVVAYYVGDELLVEQVYTFDGKYRLTSLPTREVMLARITESLAISNSSVTERQGAFSLSAAILSESLPGAQRKADFELGRIRQHQVEVERDLILVEEAKGQMWLVFYGETEATVRLEPATDESLSTRLMQLFDEVSNG